jgi:hypothetical protein
MEEQILAAATSLVQELQHSRERTAAAQGVARNLVESAVELANR